jgi:hypothetical protein
MKTGHLPSAKYYTDVFSECFRCRCVFQTFLHSLNYLQKLAHMDETSLPPSGNCSCSLSNAGWKSNGKKKTKKKNNEGFIGRCRCNCNGKGYDDNEPVGLSESYHAQDQTG